MRLVTAHEVWEADDDHLTSDSFILRLHRTLKHYEDLIENNKLITKELKGNEEKA